MRRIFSLVFSVVLAFFTCATVLAEWKFDRMISEIESKLPMAEKQAELLVKMLNSDKHLPNIQADINATNLTIPEAYIYRVLNKLECPLEDTFISYKVLTGSDNQRDKGFSLLSPDLLIGLAGGKFSYMENAVRNDKSFLANKDNAEKLVSLCEKIMAVQKPVQLAAKAKLTLKEDRTSSRTYDELYMGNNGKLSSITVKGLYGMFIPDKNIHPGELFYDDIKAKKPYILEYQPRFLKYLQEEARYLDEIGYSTGIHGVEFDDIADTIDEILAKVALTEDLSDLTAPASEEKPAEGAKEQSSDDLDIDDLQLPE